jgi:hypothetical protein
MKFDKATLNKFLHATDFETAANETFDNKNFLYDYNEVQELYFDAVHNHYVYLTGVTGLNKTRLLQKVVSDLIGGGAAKQDIIYADFELPFIRELTIESIVDFFDERNEKTKYLIVNEIGLKENFFAEAQVLRKQHANIKLLASCSIPFLVYEYLQDNPNDFSKVVVLSPKNEANIKSESDTFGVFGELKYNIKNGVCEIKGMTGKGKKLSHHVIPPEINGVPVKIIASGAFHHRSELTEITLPDTIEYIGDYAFTKCDNLKEVRLSAELAYIGDCAFLGAIKLKTITGGDAVKHIGCSAFYATAWLKEQINDFVTLGKVLYRYNGTDKAVKLPAHISAICSYAFNNADIVEIDLQCISRVGEGCFYKCAKLSAANNYPNGEVKAFTFYGCRTLSAFKQTITNAGKYVFYDCGLLETVEINNANIESGAFENCKELSAANGTIRAVGKCAFYASWLKHVDLTQTQLIGAFAFYGTKLIEAVIQNAKRIDNYAFADIASLKEVYIQSGAKIGESILWNSQAIESIEIEGKYPLSYYFGGVSNVEKLTVNGDVCDNFCRNNFATKEVSIFGGHIGNWAFYGNTNLTSVKLQKCNGIGSWAFAYCEQLTTVLIPETVGNIDMNAFRYCRKLQGIELQSSELVTFGANAFYSTAEDKHFFVVNNEAFKLHRIWKEYAGQITESDLNSRREQAQKEAERVVGNGYKAIMDRPAVAEHPKHKGLIYPINYGYIPDLIAGDGEEQDVYIIDSHEPLSEATVKIIAVVFRKNDNENKWVGTVGNRLYSTNEIKQAINFQERYYDIEIFGAESKPCLKDKIIFTRFDRHSVKDLEHEFDLWFDTFGVEKYTEIYEVAKAATGGNAITVKDLFDCARYESRIAGIMYSVFRFVELYWRRRVIEFLEEASRQGRAEVCNTITKMIPRKLKNLSIIEAVKLSLLSDLAKYVNAIQRKYHKDFAKREYCQRLIELSGKFRNDIMHQHTLVTKSDLCDLVTKTIGLLNNPELRKKKIGQINNAAEEYGASKSYTFKIMNDLWSGDKE